MCVICDRTELTDPSLADPSSVLKQMLGIFWNSVFHILLLVEIGSIYRFGTSIVSLWRCPAIAAFESFVFCPVFIWRKNTSYWFLCLRVRWASLEIVRWVGGTSISANSPHFESLNLSGTDVDLQCSRTSKLLKQRYAPLLRMLFILWRHALESCLYSLAYCMIKTIIYSQQLYTVNLYCC